MSGRGQSAFFGFVVLGLIGSLWVSGISWTEGLRPHQPTDRAVQAPPLTPPPPEIVWHTPLPISAGIPLTDVQLNAKFNVEGIPSYNPDVGTILTIGRHELTVRFQPRDASKYSTSTQSVYLVVNPAPSRRGETLRERPSPSPVQIRSSTPTPDTRLALVNEAKTLADAIGILADEVLSQTEATREKFSEDDAKWKAFVEACRPSGYTGPLSTPRSPPIDKVELRILQAELKKYKENYEQRAFAVHAKITEQIPDIPLEGQTDTIASETFYRNPFNSFGLEQSPRICVL